MASLQPPRGTSDLLPPDSERFMALCALATERFERAGFRQIITPMFEDTALFHRGIGESSEVVRKETYTFLDRSDNSLTLRPEGTAPVMRAIVSNHLWDEGTPIKLHYEAAMFRYERPQKGRVRQHHQLGVEAVGSEDATLDADVIAVGWSVLEAAEVGGVTLLLNSMGCARCRGAYLPIFVAAMQERVSQLSEDSQRRLVENPLRIWDSKDPGDQAALVGVPTLTDALCEGCAAHFAEVRELLTGWGIPFTLRPGLVRGFDYYTRTAFEYASETLEAAQNALGGGGRYDGLVESIGGPKLPGIGFGLGIERILLAQQAAGTARAARTLDLLVIPVRREDVAHAMRIVRAARDAGASSDLSYGERGLKAHMRNANRLGARFVAICGEQETSAGSATLRDLVSGEQQELGIDEAVARVCARPEEH